MNIKLRFQNKATLTAIIFAAIAIVYKILDIIGVIPPVEQTAIKELAEMCIYLLCLLGIVVDPTTKGIRDSLRARGYDKPHSDTDDTTQDEEEDDA